MSLVEGLSHDYIGDSREIRELVPQRLLGFRESVAVTLEAEKNHQTPARWVEGSIACRDWNPRYSFYAKKFCGEHETHASREAIFRVLQQFAKDGDFFSYRPLWWLRRAFDWLIGGPSFRTGRRDPDTLRMGDVVDGWRVLGLQPNERLTLSMLMRAPGSGLQEFNICERGDRRVIEMCAYWHPAGLWGLLYWYAHLPLYSPLVNSAVAEIARRAEALDARDDRPMDQGTR
jgi:hypothetical protein